MKIKYGGNKISAKICEVNNCEYLQKLTFTEVMLKIYNYFYTARFLTSSSIQSSKNKHHDPTFKSKF